MLHALSTIAEIDAEIAAGTATLAQARKILTPRSKKDSASGRRASAWLKAHKSSSTPKAQAKPQVKSAPAPKAEVQADFTPEQKRLVWEIAAKRVARQGLAKGAPGWKRAFMGECKAIYEAVKADRAEALV